MLSGRGGDQQIRLRWFGFDRLPYQPASGQIYIYDRQRDMWYMLDFEDARESFSTETFEQVYREYKLLAYVEQPGLLQNLLDHRSDSVAAPGVTIAAADLDHDLEMAFMETMADATEAATQIPRQSYFRVPSEACAV
jgi:hypothetical protein